MRLERPYTTKPSRDSFVAPASRSAHGRRNRAVPAGKEKTALLSGTRFQCDAENSEPDGCEFMQATAARRLRAVPVA